MQIIGGVNMNNIGTRRFETERLILRRFKLSDVDAVFDNWASDEEVSRYVGWNAHKDKIETLQLVSGWIEDYKNKSYNWAVELKDTHELIGNISAFNVSKKNSNCEIGYCYGREFWGRGYATEALKAVLDHMLKECEMHIVEAKHYSLNPSSGRVMQKAGMIKEAVLKERRYEEASKTYSDLIYYSKKL